MAGDWGRALGVGHPDPSVPCGVMEYLVRHAPQAVSVHARWDMKGVFVLPYIAWQYLNIRAAMYTSP